MTRTQVRGMDQCSLSEVQGVWEDTAYSRHFFYFYFGEGVRRVGNTKVRK